MTDYKSGSRPAGMRSRNTSSRATQSRNPQGRPSRELQEARRKKRQRQVMRNRIIFGVACALILAIIIFLITKLVGHFVGSGSAATTSTLTFENDGKIVFEEIVDFDTDIYDESSLEDFVEENVSSFNDAYGSEAIEIEKISVSDNKSYVRTSYVDADAYSAATSYQTFNDTYESAIEAGYSFNTTFAAVTEATKGEGQNIDADTVFAGKRVAVVNENVTVVVPGTIEYVSDASTEVVADNTIKISPADGNEDSTELVYIIYSVE